MGILFGREKRSWTAEPIIPPIRGSDPSSSFGVDSALAVSTVWSCVSLLSRSVSMLPLETFRFTDGISTRVTDPKVIVNPSEDMTQSEWIAMVMVSALMRGNAYGRISARDGYGRATQIDLLSPDMVYPKIDRDTGAITYEVGQHHERVRNDDMWHFRGMTLPGQKVGLSPIAHAAATIGIDLSSRKFAGDFFAGGGIPKAVLTSDQPIDQTQATTIKERLLAATRNREPIVLGAGLGYHAMSVTPNESQFLETQRANVPQIARYFGVPPEMVGGSSGSSMTYANVEQRSIDFLVYSVAWWLKRIEDSLFPVLAPTTFVRFNVDALLRTDAETQAKIRIQNLAGKVTTPTEERAKMNLAPMTSDQRDEANMVPLTITPLGAAKGGANLKDLPFGAPPVPSPSDPNVSKEPTHAA